MDRYDRVLLQRALARTGSSAGLLGKAQAISELNERNTPVPLERIRTELEWIVGKAPRIGTDRAFRAQSMSARLISIMEGEDPDEEKWDWSKGDLVALQLYFSDELRKLVGWRISQREWRDPDSPRVAWLRGHHESVVASDDPFEAANQIFDDPPLAEARAIAAADPEIPRYVPEPSGEPEEVLSPPAPPGSA